MLDEKIKYLVTEDDDSASDSGSETSPELIEDGWLPEECLQDAVDSLHAHTRFLMRTSCRTHSTTTEPSAEEARQTDTTFVAHDAAGYYVRLILDRFQNASTDTAIRLGEANWQRATRLRMSGATTTDLVAKNLQVETKTVFKQASTFHDSGLGSSMPHVPDSASVFSSASSLEGVSARVPNQPQEGCDGSPFECFICYQTVQDIRTRGQWKYVLQLFATVCQLTITGFTSFRICSRISAVEAGVKTTWTCFPRVNNGSSMRNNTTIAFMRHLRITSLALYVRHALPMSRNSTASI